MPKGITENQLHFYQDEESNRLTDKPKYLKRANEAKIRKLRKKYECVFASMESCGISTTRAYAAEVDRFLGGMR